MCRRPEGNYTDVSLKSGVCMMNPFVVTRSYKGVYNCIVTPVEITNTENGKTVRTLAIWDTGATGSVVTKKVASDLGFVPVSKGFVNTAGGVVETGNYYAQITLLGSGSYSVKRRVTECPKLSAADDVGMLIGMDIITLGDFAITNLNGQTVMSFRIPSMGRIDFSVRE